MTRTLVAFHAHPDDEAVLTAGTMARAAAQGHRVVLVLATDGGLGRGDGIAVDDPELGRRRLDEARMSARVLGVARVAYLGYADSGAGSAPTFEDPSAAGRTPFAAARLDEAAQRLARVLTEERADVLLSYDRNGGYGHPDHVRVHHVAAEAARRAGTPRVLQATAPRDLLCGALGLLARFGFTPSGLERARCHRVYSARAEITHRVRVYRYAGRKRASLRAHASQTAARGGADRVLAACLRLPRPLYDLVFGLEWFVDADHRGPVSGDIFAGLPCRRP